MKLKLLAVLLGLSLGVVIAQETPEQYPGQKDHAKPPKDYACTGGPETPIAHRCKCKNMPKDKDDPVCKTYEAEDDAACFSYCHKEHCSCKSSCPDT